MDNVEPLSVCGGLCTVYVAGACSDRSATSGINWLISSTRPTEQELQCLKILSDISSGYVGGMCWKPGFCFIRALGLSLCRFSGVHSLPGRSPSWDQRTWSLRSLLWTHFPDVLCLLSTAATEEVPLQLEIFRWSALWSSPGPPQAGGPKCPASSTLSSCLARRSPCSWGPAC